MTLPRSNAGFTLLEVLIAVTIVGIAGLASIHRLAAANATLTQVRRQEAEIGSAQNLMVTVLVSSKRELDRRIGATRWGAFIVTIDRPRRGLYRVAIGRGRRELLVTVIYRSDQ